MEKLLLLSLFFHISSSVQHSLEYLFTGSSGIPNFPEFMITVKVDDTVMGYCNTIKKKVEPRHDWMKHLFENDPGHLQWCKYMCFVRQPKLFNDTINSLMKLYGQTGGVHILQGIVGREWDDETEEDFSFSQFGYDGEDVLSFDLKTMAWIPLKPESETIKQIWNDDRVEIKETEIFLTRLLPMLVKKYVAFANGSQLIKVPPSVFLLQQTPSSPVRCFTSGFYPERASLFWRKDGDELHEDVELGEILPNTDGTFQMSVDLNISSITPEDWRRYECVFQLFGVKDNIITKLDKTAIRTNWRETEIREEPSRMTVPIVASVAVLLVLIAAVGFIIYRYRKKEEAPQPSPELSEQLNQRPEFQTHEMSLLKQDDEVNT